MPEVDELTVQRFSAEVAAKAQKYTRIGPREFVPFDESEEMTIGNIKSACERHFLPTIGKNLVCDILAGEQGPSCKSLSQIPDLKVVYICFIPDTADSKGNVDNSMPSTAKKRKIAAESLTYSDFVLRRQNADQVPVNWSILNNNYLRAQKYILSSRFIYF